MDFPEISGALRLFFLGFCGAKPICFLGGNELQGAAKAAILFLTGTAGFIWYTKGGHKLIRRTIFVGFNSRPVQIGFA